jgi:hypothetical protein
MQVVIGWALFAAAIAAISIVAGRERKRIEEQEEQLRKNHPQKAA